LLGGHNNFETSGSFFSTSQQKLGAFFEAGFNQSRGGF
jgi:hypothetical protein